MSSHAYWPGVFHLSLILACIMVCEGGLLEFLTTILKNEAGAVANEGQQRAQGVIEFPALNEMNSEERESNRQRARKVATIIEKNVHLLANDMLQMWAITRKDTDDEGDMAEELEELEEGRDEGQKESKAEATAAEEGDEGLKVSGAKTETAEKDDEGRTEAGAEVVTAGEDYEKNNESRSEEEAGREDDEEHTEVGVEAATAAGEDQDDGEGTEVEDDGNSSSKDAQKRARLGMNRLELVAKSVLQDETKTKANGKGDNVKAVDVMKNDESKSTREENLVEEPEKSRLVEATSSLLVGEDKHDKDTEEGPPEGPHNAKVVEGGNPEGSQTNSVKDYEDKNSDNPKANKPKEIKLESPDVSKTNDNKGKDTKTKYAYSTNGGKEKPEVTQTIYSSTIREKAVEEAKLGVKEDAKVINTEQEKIDSVGLRNNRPVPKEGNEVKIVNKSIDGSLKKRPLKTKEIRRGKYVISDDLEDLAI